MSILPFDKRDGYIWFDGKIVPWADATLHFLSHGLHYGGAVFEGERAYDGKIFKSAEHSARFKRSAENSCRFHHSLYSITSRSMRPSSSCSKRTA